MNLAPPSPRPSGPTRRSLIRAGAWSAPVVVVAGAVPAYATSAPSLRFLPGATAVVVDANATNYDNLRFTGATVVNMGPALAAGALTLTVTFTGTVVNANAAVWVNSLITGWSNPGTGPMPSGVVFTYSSALAAGATLAIPNGEQLGFGSPRAQQQGQLRLTFSAVGRTSGSAAFSSLPARAGARGSTGTDKG